MNPHVSPPSCAHATIHSNECMMNPLDGSTVVVVVVVVVALLARTFAPSFVRARRRRRWIHRSRASTHASTH